MKTNSRSIFFDLIKVAFILIVIGACLGSIYVSDRTIENKIILAGFFIMLGIIANEISKLSNLNTLTSEIHAKTLMQLILTGKKQGVKEDVGKIFEEIEENEIKSQDFHRRMFGDFDLMAYFGMIVLILIVAYITTLII